ncbi:MAG: T9SS type A sorting domain-containing protein, partial [Bacteroidota bacterium]
EQIQASFPTIPITTLIEGAPQFDGYPFSLCLQDKLDSLFQFSLPGGIPNCCQTGLNLSDYYAYLGQTYPTYPFVFFGFLRDSVIRAFYDLGGNACANLFNLPGSGFVSGIDYENALFSLRNNDMNNTNGLWHTFLYSGSEHIFLAEDSLFYTANLCGTQFYDWLALIANGDSVNRHLASGEACPTVLSLSFSAPDIQQHGNQIHLQWQDIPNRLQYVIERQNQHGHFEAIGTSVLPAFMDEFVSSRRSIAYRIRAQLSNGNEILSQRAAYQLVLRDMLRVSQNPFRSQLLLSVPAARLIQLHIYDLNGRLVYAKEMSAALPHSIEIPTHSWPAMPYVLQGSINGQRFQQKLLKR